MSVPQVIENSPEDFTAISQGRVEGVCHRIWAESPRDWSAFAAELESGGGETVRKGGGQGVTSRMEHGGEPYFCKIYRPGKLHRRVRDLVGRLRCVREWESHVAAARIGIASARVLAAFAVKAPLNTTHYFLTAPAPGASIWDAAEALGADAVHRQILMRDLGTYVAGLHARGFYHAHLHCPHIFVAEGNHFTLIDLEHSRVATPFLRVDVENNLRQLRGSLSRRLDADLVSHFNDAYRHAADSGGKTGKAGT